MNTRAERDVSRRIPIGSEHIGIVELPWVAVGRPPCKQHAGSRRNDCIADGVVDQRCAIEALHRRRETQLFLDGWPD
jgi:hypothetical protein